MNIQTMCDRCEEWVAVGKTLTCVDCSEDMCLRCAEQTGHRPVHEAPLPNEATVMPQGWHYLRCKQTPFSIHGEDA